MERLLTVALDAVNMTLQGLDLRFRDQQTAFVKFRFN